VLIRGGVAWRCGDGLRKTYDTHPDTWRNARKNATYEFFFDNIFLGDVNGTLVLTSMFFPILFRQQNRLVTGPKRNWRIQYPFRMGAIVLENKIKTILHFFPLLLFIDIFVSINIIRQNTCCRQKTWKAHK